MRLDYFIVASIFLLVSACSTESPENGKGKSDAFCIDSSFEKKIELTDAKLEEVSASIHLIGSVEVNPDKEVHFTSLVSGMVTTTFFSLGDKVKNGQVLLEMRSAELSMLQAESASIKAQIRLAERELSAAKSMYEQGMYAEKEYIKAQSELAVLKANEARVGSDLSLYQASNEKGVFQIKAPRDGVITAKNVSAGMSVSSESGVLFTVADLEDVWVMAAIFAGNIQYVHPGMKVKMKTNSYDDKVFEGEISLISSVLDEDAKVLKARIVLNNKDQLLKPGMLMDLHVLKESTEKAISVPTDAIVFSDNLHYVVVFKDSCNLEARKVSVQAKNQFQTYLSSGLKEGEKVISKNPLLVFEAIR
jgi:membrane fusion protein, heavy metal efflux system